MISKNIGSFPVQKLPMSKKTKEWKENCVDYIIGKSGFSNGGGNNGRTRYEEMQTYYDLYNSIYNEKISYMSLIHLNRKTDSLLLLRITT